MSFDVPAALAHVRAAINGADIRTEPFPHVVALDVLPGEVYRSLLASWPPAELLVFTNSNRRRQLTLEVDLEKFPPEIREFWRTMSVVTEAATRLLVARLRPHFGVKLAPLIGDDWSAELDRCELVSRSTALASYNGQIELPPHVDHVRILTNAFLYCSELDRVEPELGTWLYRSLGLALPTNIQLRRQHLDMCLRRHTLVPYQANSCLAYVNGPTSFHGVEPADIGARERRLLLFSSRLKIKDVSRLLGEAFVAPPRPE
ncbi:MAG: hypothetical protein FJX35_14330 [Alphaproteobacteria bacterium]|nr:hypothetical protein [Alphaproteobacteria bacterium]